LWTGCQEVHYEGCVQLLLMLLMLLVRLGWGWAGRTVPPVLLRLERKQRLRSRGVPVDSEHQGRWRQPPLLLLPPPLQRLR
jgi:hypothetical protein